MEKEPLRVLFLCTGNSARSQIGEALLRHMSRGKIEVASAGSRPRPEIHPMARHAMNLRPRGARNAALAGLSVSLR